MFLLEFINRYDNILINDVYNETVQMSVRYSFGKKQVLLVALVYNTQGVLLLLGPF